MYTDGDTEKVTYDPGILQRNHVVNVNVARLGPRRAVVGTLPGARRRSAGVVCLDIVAVALQDILAVFIY